MAFRQPLAALQDGASLALFRIAWGLLVLWESYRYLAGDPNRVTALYVWPSFHFTYWPFDFVQPWPGYGMYAHFLLLAATGIFVAMGWLYRLSSALLFLLVTYAFLLEQAKYLNHMYLICLVAFLMILVPAHRTWSVDGYWTQQGNRPVPLWSIQVLRFQIAVPYFFGAIAKLNADWLRGMPITEWLSARTDFPWIGSWFAYPEVGLAFAYGGMLFDLTIPFFLLSSRLRPFAFIAVLLFHTTNSRLFSIGVFPWFMIVATTIFMPTNWPRILWARFKHKDPAAIIGCGLGAILPLVLGTDEVVVPGLCGALGWSLGLSELKARLGKSRVTQPQEFDEQPTLSKPAFVALCFWVATQCLIPLRHFLIDGLVHWTEEGHRFSWHMKLRDKDGEVQFRVVRDGESLYIDPQQMLTRRQYRKMSTRPYLMLQYAHHLRDIFLREGAQDVQVFAMAYASLNGRPMQLLIDPTTDLSKVPRPWWGHAPWITPHPDAGALLENPRPVSIKK